MPTKSIKITRDNKNKIYDKLFSDISKETYVSTILKICVNFLIVELNNILFFIIYR